MCGRGGEVHYRSASLHCRIVHRYTVYISTYIWGISAERLDEHIFVTFVAFLYFQRELGSDWLCRQNFKYGHSTLISMQLERN